VFQRESPGRAIKPVPEHRSKGLIQFCKTVFYIEGWLLVVTGTLMMIVPEFVAAQQGMSSSAVSNGNLRQFGAMCILMGYVGIVAPVVQQIVEACLLGDFLWFAAFIPLVYHHGDWTSAGSLFSVLSVVFLAATRLIFLLDAHQ